MATKKKATKKKPALKFWGVLIECKWAKNGYDLTCDNGHGGQIRSRAEAREAVKTYKAAGMKAKIAQPTV